MMWYLWRHRLLVRAAVKNVAVAPSSSSGRQKRYNSGSSEAWRRGRRTTDDVKFLSPAVVEQQEVNNSAERACLQRIVSALRALRVRATLESSRRLARSSKTFHFYAMNALLRQHADAFRWQRGVTPLSDTRLLVAVPCAYVLGVFGLRRLLRGCTVPLGPLPALHNLVLMLWSAAMFVGVAHEALQARGACGHANPARGMWHDATSPHLLSGGDAHR